MIVLFRAPGYFFARRITLSRAELLFRAPFDFSARRITFSRARVLFCAQDYFYARHSTFPRAGLLFRAQNYFSWFADFCKLVTSGRRPQDRKPWTSIILSLNYEPLHQGGVTNPGRTRRAAFSNWRVVAKLFSTDSIVCSGIESRRELLRGIQ